MTVYRRVESRDIDDLTATETLECGHAYVLYRQVRGNRVAWANERGVATNLSARSRECAECGRAETRTRARGWPS